MYIRKPIVKDFLLFSKYLTDINNDKKDFSDLGILVIKTFVFSDANLQEDQKITNNIYKKLDEKDIQHLVKGFYQTLGIDNAIKSYTLNVLGSEVFNLFYKYKKNWKDISGETRQIIKKNFVSMPIDTQLSLGKSFDDLTKASSLIKEQLNENHNNVRVDNLVNLNYANLGITSDLLKRSEEIRKAIQPSKFNLNYANLGITSDLLKRSEEIRKAYSLANSI